MFIAIASFSFWFYIICWIGHTFWLVRRICQRTDAWTKFSSLRLKKKNWKPRDSLLWCVCLGVDLRRLQNVIGKLVTHSAGLPVALFYLILTSSVIYYWTDARQPEIHFSNSALWLTLKLTPFLLCTLKVSEIKDKNVRGMIVFVLSQTTGSLMAVRAFDTYSSKDEGQELIKFFGLLQEGRIVCVAVKASWVKLPRGTHNYISKVFRLSLRTTDFNF